MQQQSGAAAAKREDANRVPEQTTLEIVPPGPEPAADRPPEQLLIRMLEVVRDRVESIHVGQRSIADELRNELRSLRGSLPMQRRPLSRRTQAIHIHATLTRRNGLCPCCQETPVCNESGRLPGAEFDHFFARDKNRVTQTWLTCGHCNARLIDTDYRAAARSAFEAYQAALRPLLGRQVQLDLKEEPRS